MIQALDDHMHPPASDHRYWTETSWWAFSIPERRLSGTVYNLFRPNLGIVASGVYIWDHTSRSDVDALYQRQLWHLEIPDGAGPCDISLASGLIIEMLEPLRRHRLRYDDDAGRCRFDLLSEAVGQPHPVTIGYGTDTPGTGHFDQTIRVTGTLELNGERMDVDCLALRDRSWHLRSELGMQQFTVGYTYGAASPELAFHVLFHVQADDPSSSVDDAAAITGFLTRDGVLHDVVGGRRRVLAREDGVPLRVALEIVDDTGRTLRAEGEAHNRFLFHGSPFNPCWFTLMRWTFDDGTEGWGEDQDCWGPPMHLAEYLRTTREGFASEPCSR